MNPRYDKTPPREPTYEDGLHKQMWDAAYAAAVAVMKDILKEEPHKLVRSLGKNDMAVLVGAVTGAYAVKRAELESYEREHADDLRRAALEELDIFG